jgi:hypothetical protein
LVFADKGTYLLSTSTLLTDLGIS